MCGEVFRPIRAVPCTKNAATFHRSDERNEWNMSEKIALIGPYIAPLRDGQLPAPITEDTPDIVLAHGWHNSTVYLLQSARTGLVCPPPSQHPTTTEAPQETQQVAAQPSQDSLSFCANMTLFPPHFCADLNMACSSKLLRRPCRTTRIVLHKNRGFDPVTEGPLQSGVLAPPHNRKHSLQRRGR